MPKYDLGNNAFLDKLLTEQRRLHTPVAKFSELYDEGHAPAQRFSHLIPLSKPKVGEQYAFEVNLDACTACKACVAACHSLNGLDDDESWRDVGHIHSNEANGYQQTVTTACHHCVDPACLNGCPVLAYEKSEVTGIVRHLDDQCIGCSYCVMKCPYDVPKFNAKRGIVRKCDMCQDRLAVGEAPACVQACPTEAIKIRVIAKADVPQNGSIITGAFESSYTKPTTKYLSSRVVPLASEASDARHLKLDHAHTPLAVMLVFTQLSTGTFLFTALAYLFKLINIQTAGWSCAVGCFFGSLGIVMSTLHLGQPLKAWRVFLGWRRSWLSREILVFGGFGGASGGTMMAWYLGWELPFVVGMLATVGAGLLAVFCSIMVYVDTKRPFWNFLDTTVRFGGTTIGMGAFTCAAVFGLARAPVWQELFFGACALSILLALREAWIVNRAIKHPLHPWHKPSRVMITLQPRLLRLRGFLTGFACVFLPILIPGLTFSGGVGLVCCVWMFLVHLIERHQFFTAACGSKMPGL